MDIDKLIYDIIEKIPALSDDRDVSERLILHHIGIARAAYIRTMLGKRIGAITTGIEQSIPVSVETVSRSTVQEIPIACKVQRTVNSLPKLIHEASLGPFFRVHTIDILRNTIEVIDPSRVASVYFEFPAVYAFLHNDYRVYFIEPNNGHNIENAVITGVFEDPFEVNPALIDYPLKAYMWDEIKPKVVDSILTLAQRDPLNNSEQDLNQQKDGS